MAAKYDVKKEISSMPEGLMEQLLSSSHYSGGNAAYIEGLYETYLHDPNGVPEEWSSFFRLSTADQRVNRAGHLSRHYYSAL
jgi:2-oxoglutarate dehydrogenase E1 component